MESSQIKGLFIIVLSAMFAVYLGVAAATASFEALAWVAGFVGIAFVLALGEKIWALIPMTLVLQGNLNAVPGSPPVWAGAAAAVFAIYFARLALRRPDFVFRLDWLDVAVFLHLAVIAQAYARTPTGLLILGGNTAGGKSYFLFGVAIVAYFLLSFTKPNVKVIKRVVVAMIVVQILDATLLTISDRVPSVASLILPIYSNVNLGVAIVSGGGSSINYDTTRGGSGFSMLGKALVIPCFTMTRPLNSLNPLRPLIFLISGLGGVLILLSGFRSGFAYLGGVFLVSSLVRKRYMDVVAMGLIGVTLLGILAVSGNVKSLPFGAQRVLSILPMVEVRAEAREDAENSTEWRYEMWRLALTTNHYIKDKVLGDGFGLSGREMKAISEEALGISSSNMSSQEKMLAQGSYHGFHVETIRFTGALGLLSALVIMVAAFRKALKLVRFYRGKELFPYVAYICIPALLYPFWSMLVFGSYRVEFPQFIAMVGVLKILDNLRLAEMKTVPSEAAVPVKDSPLLAPV